LAPEEVPDLVLIETPNAYKTKLVAKKQIAAKQQKKR